MIRLSDNQVACFWVVSLLNKVPNLSCRITKTSKCTKVFSITKNKCGSIKFFGLSGMTCAVAPSLPLNPIFSWVPSQNGLFSDCPHLHSAYSDCVGNFYPQPNPMRILLYLV